MPTPYIAEVKLISFNYAPKGWALCNGQLLPINQNQALFSLIGTRFGGDGRTNFALPDLRQRSIIGTGAAPGLSPYQVGQQVGANGVPLFLDQIPAHGHLLNVSGGAASTPSPIDAHLAVSPSAVGALFDTATTGSMPAVLPSGRSEPHENRQPYMELNYVIALTGIFPPRP